MVTDEAASATDLMAVQLYDLPPLSTMDVYWRAAAARRIQKRNQYRVKRLFDLVIASILLTVLVPVLLLIAIAVRLTSRGPILYRQTRLGRDWQEFTLFKFRTMVDGADRMLDQVVHLNEAKGPLFKSKQDPRVTAVGRILRATFSDELPQLINVIRGEMSLVGPRPCLPVETAHMEAQVIFRFAVPQGITGPWQTNGYHAVTFEERLRLEQLYVARWSLWNDLQILVRTFPVVFGRRGA